MANKSTDEKVTYFKNRILSFILNHPGEYGAKDIGDIFGFTKRRIQDYVKYYNSIGFYIRSKKGKYNVLKLPYNYKTIKDSLNITSIKKAILYENLKEFNKEKINKSNFINYVIQNKICDVETEKYANKLLYSLKKDGYINMENNYIFIDKNPLDVLNKDEILSLLIYINVMKNIYPRRVELHSIFLKLLVKFEKLGGEFNNNIIIYPHKHNISAFDERILQTIDKAIYEKRKINFIYKTYKSYETIEEIPLGLVYNHWKDLWYMLCSNDRLYRLDRIVYIEIGDKLKYLPDFNKDLLSKSFGASMEKVTSVEIHFDKEDFIFRKLKVYSSIRKTASIEEKSDKYILRDEVCGVREIEKWVRSFGKSAKCIKPLKLKDRISKDIELLKERYGINE
ncbi:hypothetical protein CLOACE_04720 [Clostridium acetireducens DSM 10703]|uniref:Uncharacterized protein n=1 Tax=Clostridium acetireducens DSM 10703 TaxID=1121290 RepID=A0A1E8F0W8_9CLOT|nr:WYL domain-containing protein [Clostridium acetireducens]OFI07067.1 hypothetical protein CLOACE_04720 [Clostridium acetireducens DSM 10703]